MADNMDLQSRKLEIIQEFLKIQSEDLLIKIEELLKLEKARVREEDLEPMSLEEFNSRIGQSVENSKNNKLLEANEFKAIIEKWN